jgi:hypothetical protein
MDVSSLLSNSQVGSEAAGSQDRALDKPSINEAPGFLLRRARRGRQKRQREIRPTQPEEGASLILGQTSAGRLVHHLSSHRYWRPDSHLKIELSMHR